MAHDFAAAMRRATNFTRGGDVAAATRVIQEALAGRTNSESSDREPSDHQKRLQYQSKIQRVGSDREAAEEVAPSSERRDAAATPVRGISLRQPSPRPRRPLAEVVRLLREGRARFGAIGPWPGMTGLRTSQPPAIPEGAQFLLRSFTCAAGTRSYKLYVPASAPERPRGLVVMLHGCKQNPDDFATGTKMNAVAELHGLLVAYPAQTGDANASSCWNWFDPGDQMRDVGEPSIIAGATREIMSEFHLDRRQVFVAGLSAGGAMAAVMGETYPDLYAAVGIHSGLAYRSANDVISAFAAMRGGAASPLQAKQHAPAGSETRLRTIVFHGTADQIVDPSNAARIVDAASRSIAVGNARKDHGSFMGRTYNRMIIADANGDPHVECWLIDGAGHAWFGGHPSGSFTDPKGPHASAEMVRFFLTHPADDS